MQPLAIVALVLAGLVALAVAKPPPTASSAPGGPGGPPGASSPWSSWMAFSAKPGPMQSRSLVGLGPMAMSADYDASSAAAPPSPFLKMKPFFPMKPTFAPPVVDPSKFIDMKADLLNSLFPGGFPVVGPVSGAAPAPYSLSARALLSPFAAPDVPAAPAAPVVKPPPPAFLADLFKALNINKTVANASEPVAPPAYPAFPASPAAAFPAAPFVDPGIFISKKAKFLSDLFAGLATTTPAPAVAPAAPADSAALNMELAASLQRLLDSLNTSTAPEDVPEDVPEDEQTVAVGKAKRAAAAADSAALVADAKDKVVETIIGELVELKDSMVGAVTDLALAQKAADAAQAAATAAAAASKKPVSPYAAMWAKPGATAAPTKPPVPVEPVHQKVVLLGQVFDMLTDMEKDIASSMVAAPSADVTTPSPPDFVEAMKAKISQIMAHNNVTLNQTSSASSPLSATQTAALGSSPKSLRLAPAAGPTVDPTFWIPDSVVVGPDAYLAKTKEFISNIMASKSTPTPVVKRSYKTNFQYQQPSQSTTQQQQKTENFNPEIPPEPTFPYYRGHHHNHRPYWWN